MVDKPGEDQLHPVIAGQNNSITLNETDILTAIHPFFIAEFETSFQELINKSAESNINLAY